MLLKSQTIINQEELVSILEAQLKKAKSRLTELTKADTKIKSVIAELESLLTEHPDYKLLVSDRLKLKECEVEETIRPVRIEIEQELDPLDTLTEKIDSASKYKLKFGRIDNTVAVGYGNKIIGKYGISDSKIWMDKSLSAYFVEEHGIQVDDIISEFNSETPQDVVEAYDSLFGEAPPQNMPHTEKIESPYSSSAEIAKVNAAFNKISEKNVGATEQSLDVNEAPAVEPEPTPTLEELKQQLLSKATRAELDTFKANIGEAAVKEIWELCSIPERNQIKCLSKAKIAKQRPATLGYKFQYKGKYEAIYLGYYLHGEPVKEEDDRVIFVKGEAIICKKTDILPHKNQPELTPEDRVRFEAIISEPLNEQPSADEIAANTFTGLEPTKKLKVVQAELNLKVEQPAPSKKTEVIPTPLLEMVAHEIKKVNPSLTFDYDTNDKSTFLEIFHGSSNIGMFEDDGEDLWSFNTAKMLHHGFTKEIIDALSEIELSKKA
ncbi:MAG: hypothetical protein SWX82_32710 [Cyanobacteriota bacterium]|nr:hypothetical protein [Cyanobacteriota bacterium]